MALMISGIVDMWILLITYKNSEKKGSSLNRLKSVNTKFSKILIK
jgi:hypothetical protein